MSSFADRVPQVRSEVEANKPTEREIASLAYQIWEDRGCPIGSPDEDWFLAESELMNHPKVFTAAA